MSLTEPKTLSEAMQAAEARFLHQKWNRGIPDQSAQVLWQDIAVKYKGQVQLRYFMIRCMEWGVSIDKLQVW